ncbi:MAG: SusC/RagA family TonB-linked outer membrane protein, partial [Paramuribaculum sp.]|nr:SusC/RagA family TonB-linked outer membrane protein [Paramuribaculum sp.]
YQFNMHSSDYGRDLAKVIRKAWTPENPYTDVPRLDALDSYSNSSSDRWLVSSNYLSLNNVTIGYSFPGSIVQKLHLSQLRIYGAAENVALWSARKGLDPRQSYTSSEGEVYSGIRCISGGIRIGF